MDFAQFLFNLDDTIEVPDILNSPESLKFCGMSDEAATEIFDRWSENNEKLQPGQMGFGQNVIELARSFISFKARNSNAFTEGDDWDGALRSQGIKIATRVRILDPNFKILRLSASASEWALDTLNSSWEFLDGLDERVQNKKKEKDVRSTSPDPSVKPSKAIKPTSLLSALHSGSSSLKLAIESEPPKEVLGRTFLYKGGSWNRLITIFNPDGSLNAGSIVSKPPCDFHPSDYDLYFTKQQDVAREYAEYAHRRIPAQEPAILTVGIPSEWMGTARGLFGLEWKKLIWCCRNQEELVKNFGKLPDALKELEDYEVLLGDICYQSNDQVTRLKSWDDIAVMKTSKGVKGTQVVLKGSLMGEKFNKECRGFVWVGTLAFPTKAKHFPMTE
ncbi:hypothetical protein N0V90_002158 [Kalmusia sp. IMI 367209]|nr:hypothetical protein N0V90_002158 [Kalmusia sp. IMI 367209]